MLLLHHGLLAGRPVADALATAQEALAGEGGLRAAAAAGFVSALVMPRFLDSCHCLRSASRRQGC